MSGPLDGVRVIDVGTAYVGPWAATLLGMLGADVIKLESPTGDRHHFQPPRQSGVATTYTSVNLNKRAIILDVKDPAIRPAIDRLIRQADVITDNLRPGVIDRMGLGYDRASALNPRIISASSPAWGTTGPMKNLPALDSQVQVFSGFAALNGLPGDRPEMLRYPQLDINGACYFASTVVLGLIARERRGTGMRVSASHLGSAINLQTSRLAEYLVAGETPRQLGSACAATVPNQYFACQDLQYLAVSIETDHQWQGLCRAVQRPDLAADERFATNRSRVANRETLIPVLDEVFGSRPSRWWAVRLEAEQVPFGHLLDYEMLRHHSQVLENGYIQQIMPLHQGPMDVGGPPWQFSKTRVKIDPLAPAPGANTEEVVADGFGKDVPLASTSAGAMSPAPVSLPLAGIRVIEAAQGYAGPFVGLMLAEAGAEVIKVEPPEGDYSRGFTPKRPDGTSALFATLNRNKRGVVLDLATDAGSESYLDLIKTADIVLEDWGPNVAENADLGYRAAAAVKPDILYLALSWFGERGPLRDRAGSELVMQGWSEYWKNLGKLGGQPERIGADMAGLGTGILAFLGVTAALYHRLKTGEGQRIAMSHLGAMLSQRTAQWAAMSNPDEWENDTFCNNHIRGQRFGYETADRPIYCNLNNGTEEQFFQILDELGMLDEVVDDPRFGEGGRHSIGVGKYSRELMPIWEKYFKARPSSEVLDILNRNGGGAVAMLTVEELFEHPQIQTLNLLSTDRDGRRYVRAPWNGPWDLPEVQPAPGLGVK